MAGLNLCCGIKLLDDFINVDRMDIARKFPDKVAGKEFICVDLNKRPWPWGDGWCDHIVMRDGLEHLASGTFLEVMAEIWRILKPSGMFICQVPNAANFNAFTDPTHQSFYTDRSFDYLDPSTVIGALLPHYSDYKFKILKIDKPDDGTLQFHLKKIV